MKNFNYFEKLWEHSRTLRRVGLVLVMCLMAIPHVWAYSIWGAKTIYVDNLIAEWEQPEMQVYKNEGTKPSYRFTQIGTTSFWYYYFSSDWDGYDHIYYYNYVNDAWGNKSAQQKYDVHPSSFAVVVPKSGDEGCAIGYFTDTKKANPDHRIYFDATPIAGWGSSAYLRYGFDCVAHADPMTKFPGTANLFYIDCKEAYYEKYTVANAAGYTKANTVYQPTSKCKPTGDYAITKSLNFSDTDIDGGSSKVLSFIPTSKASTSEECDWWNYTKNTNTSIPTKTVTVNSTTNGKIRVDYYNTSGTSTYWEGSSGTSLTVPQSAIITVTAIGNTGYQINTLTVGGAAFTSGNTYTVTAATTISATFVAKTYSISLDKQQGSSGSTSVTMTYNSSSHTSITAPTAPTGYTFAGWYTGALGTGSMVMNASGVLQTNVTNFTGAGGIWTKDGTCTLYAKYTASYPDGYLYITDVKSNPEAGATAAISGATYNASLNGSFAHSGLEYWALVGGSTNTYTLTFASAITASATAAGVAVDVWWGANGTSSNSGTTIYLNGTDAAHKIGEAAATTDTRNQLLETLKNVRAVGTTSVSSLQLKRYNANSTVWFRVGIKEIPGYRLTYNVGDGTGAPSASYQPNATITLSSAKPTYAGHLFAGWQVNGSGTVYQPGDSFDMPAEATTLVAKWEENCYQGTITKSSGNLTASHGGETSLTASDATITSGGGIKIVNTNTGSGSVNYACSSDGMNINTTNGYIEFTLPSGSVLATGSIIRVQGKTGNSSYGLKIIDDSGNEIAKQTNNGAIDFTYTVTAQSAINGNDHVRINRVTNNGTIIKAVTVAGCGSVSCYTPAEPTISGTADYIVGETIELTADITGSNHDSNTEYTWYKGADWATALAADPVQDAAKAASNGHIFTKTAAVGDAGTYWCEASNGTGCESHNSTGKAITVAYQVTYAANGGTGDAMANSTGTSITLSANSYTAPSGYTFDGWRTVSDKQASGTDYAAGTSGITANLDLYAMWKQTVTLDDNGGSNDGSAVVYYNASSASTPTAPTYSGYTADGYYAEPGCTNLVMSTAGALTNYSGYVSGGKWVHSGATTLYAHYKCTAPTISCTDNVVTMSTTSTGATIYYTYTTDGSTPSDPTSSDNEYDSEDKPVITKDTQFKAIAIESGKTSSAVTSQSCTYTAFSSSVNIEQAVLDNGTSWGYAAALTAAKISYDLTPGDGESVGLDNLNYACGKTDMNNDYRGLKIKSSGKYIQINLQAGKTLKVRFGHRGSAVKLWIDESAQTDIPTDGNYYTYELAAGVANRVVKIGTADAKAVVIKQIMIGEDIATVAVPAPISIADGITNGSISASSTANVGSTVTVTVTPSDGYELSTLTYTPDCPAESSPVNIDKSTKQFTMPSTSVTINATFVLSGHSVTAVTSTGDDTYGTVSAAASTVAEGGTTVITAVPATGYKVTNWAVSGAGASIDPSGASNSNTTTLTMGSADATVTVTFGPKTYTLTLDKNGGSADGTATATWNSHTLTGGTDATASNLNNYYLDGYYTEADGGTEIIAALPNLVPTEVTGWISPSYDNYWIHDANETLYAHWWTMIFLNPNRDHHGTGSESSDAKGIYNGSMIEGFATAMSDISGESGYSLQGFYTAAVGGTKVLNADGTFAAENITDYVSGGKWIYNSTSYARLYAHWAKECTVTYDGNSEDDGDAPDAVDALYGTTITVATNSGSLEKTGYSFVGWNTEDDGTGTFYAVGSKFTVTGDITLYAQWESCSGGSDPILSIGASEATESTFLGTYSTEGITISSTSSWGSGYVEIKTSSSGYDTEYLEVFASSENISKVSFLLTGNGAPKTLQPVVFGWAGDASATAATYRMLDENVVDDKTYAKAEWFTYDFSEASVKRLRIYKASKNVSSTSPAYTGSSTAIGNGQTFYVWGLKVWLGSGGGCTTYDVSFADMTGFAGSSTLPDDISDVYDGATIAEPVQPTASGYAFAGWYKEGACSNKWDFSTDVVDDDITLYAKWIDVSGKYTFHYGDGQPTDNTWVIKTFTEAGSGYHKIEDFEIPDADKYPSFFVGYEGAYDTETAHSHIYTWDAATGLGNGHMPIRHWGTRYGSQSELPIAGNGNTAEGAKGTLRISTTGSTNCYVGFYPNGFGLIWNRETTALHATPSPEVFETDVVTLTAAEAAGNFEVKLATEDSYVAYSRTATETTEDQLNDRKVAGETYDIAAGTVGRFQINLSKKDNNYGLRFVPLVNRTSTSGNWETDNNWTLWRRPNIEETAYVAHFTTIKTPTAQAKKVIVDKTSGVGYPKVSIASGYDGVGGLLVEDHIQVLKMVDDEPTISEETTYSELEINSSAYGSAALIMGDASTTTAAYTTLYTKAMYDVGYGWVNQYIGTPSANGSIYDFYGSYLYVYSPVNSNWVQANRQPSYAMPTFKAYNLMREESAPGSYSFYDPLVFPGITDGKLKELICDDENDETDPEDNRTGAYMFANSWTAPIDVKAMEESDFDGSEATIYIFNAGSPAQAASAGDPSQTAVDPGQWVSIPVNAAPYLPENLTVIPSMQAFRIVTTNATASLTLDYKKHVYDPAKNRAAGIEIKPLRAPKHNDAKPNILKLFVEAASGYRDNLYLFERQDFSETFDNGWDGSKMFGISNAPQIYGVNGELKTSINAIPDLEGQQVGFMTGKADSEYTITFNYEGDDTWYFNDTKEHESTLISNDAEYTFTTEPGEDSNRFYISATPIMKVTTGVENVQSDDVQSTNVHKVLINDHIYIIRGGRMYDATGKMLK